MEALKPLSELLRDRILLVGAALLVCLIGGEAFTLADDYHINPAWVFFAWNSIFLIPIVGRRFKKTQWDNPRFIAFFGVWMVLHGVVMVFLTGRVPIIYWAPFIVLELFVGFFLARLLFGRPRNVNG
jgi:hypothetical protein